MVSARVKYAFAALLHAMHALAGRSVGVRFGIGKDNVERREYSASSRVFEISDYLARHILTYPAGKMVEEGNGTEQKMEEVELECEPEEFEMVLELLDQKPLDVRIGAARVISVLALANFLGVVDGDEKAAFYRGLAGMTTNDEDFRKEMEAHRNMQGMKIYMLQLFRENLETDGVELRVDGRATTLCPSREHGYGSTEEVGMVDEVRVLRGALSAINSEDRLDTLEWIIRNMDITKLNISCCSMDAGAKLLGRIGKMGSLTKLDVSDCGIAGGSLEHFKSLCLTELDVSGNVLLKIEDLRVIGGMESLVVLGVNYCEMVRGNLECLKDLNLAVLDVSYNDLVIDDLKVIGGMVSLTKLSITHCSGEGSLEYLKELSLAELYILGHYLGAEDLQVIGEMASLRKLGVSGCKIVRGGFVHLRDLNLTELDISGVSVSQKDWEVIRELRSRGMAIVM